MKEDPKAINRDCHFANMASIFGSGPQVRQCTSISNIFSSTFSLSFWISTSVKVQ